MKSLIIVLLTSLCLLPAVVKSSDVATLKYTLNELLSQYSKRNATEFVIDSSVTGVARIQGVSEAEITPAVIASILDVHGFSAIENKGKVHVLPKDSVEATALALGGGAEWGND